MFIAKDLSICLTCRPSECLSNSHWHNLHMSASITSLTELGLRANKILLLGCRIRFNHDGSCGEVVEYEVIKDLYKFEFSLDGETHHVSFEDPDDVLERITEFLQL